MTSIVLASTSKYRRELLQRLHVDFEITSPEVDEFRLDNESPEKMSLRLAEEKAKAVATQFPNHLIIGSDQVACLPELNLILSKPGNYENAVKQLTMMSGKIVMFYTSVCLYNSATKNSQVEIVPFKVQYRDFDLNEIHAYLSKEQPFNCAGSTQVEGLGIALMNSLSGDDPTALIGLPLITVTKMLRNEHYKIY